MGQMEATGRMLFDGQTAPTESIETRMARMNGDANSSGKPSEWLCCPVHHLPYLVNLRDSDWRSAGNHILCICPWLTPEKGLVIIERSGRAEVVARELPQSDLPGWAMQRLLYGHQDNPNASK
jgi:hypothetical protein